MDNEILIAVLELGLALFIGIGTLFLTKFIFTKIYEKKTGEDFPYKNLAFMIFLSGSIFGVAWLIYGITAPLDTTLVMLMSSDASGWQILIEFSKYMGLFLFFGYILGFGLNYLTFLLFSTLTKKVNEFDEIKEGNVGVAIMISVVIIVMSLFCQAPFIDFLESMMPFPEIPGFR
ncbi:MAG: uncharacterized membrane protein YjfL (UPF0719 family) [Arenicella sp.]|jgi:uncharacterized membrane protein YjfL (UPF0719 family)